MRAGPLVAGVALAAVAAAGATAQAQPSRFTLSVNLDRGEAATLTIGPVPQGEFAFSLRASSDDQKLVRITQRRAGGRAFTVIDTAASPKGSCQGAAGTIGCSGITTPATPGGRAWTFTVRSRGPRPTTVLLTITWRKVTSAG
jgi:hypothetical protein